MYYIKLHKLDVSYNYRTNFKSLVRFIVSTTSGSVYSDRKP